MATYITIADVREDMLDRAAEDHLVLADLAFTDEDITYGMKACARKFNALNPIGLHVTEDTLPINTSVFFDGVAWGLYKRWHRNVSVNDYDYSAGGVQANVQGNLLRNLQGLREKLEEEFVEGATKLKVSTNLDQCWGIIG